MRRVVLPLLPLALRASVRVPRFSRLVRADSVRFMRLNMANPSHPPAKAGSRGEALVRLRDRPADIPAYEAGRRAASRIAASRGEKTSLGRPLVSLTESWVPIWLPRSRCDRTPCPVCLLDLTPGRGAIRCSPRANTLAAVTVSLDYRHPIASLCSRETGKKEKIPGSEVRSLPSAVEVSGEEDETTWYATFLRIKPWKTSSVTNEARNGCPYFAFARIDAAERRLRTSLSW